MSRVFWPHLAKYLQDHPPPAEDAVEGGVTLCLRERKSSSTARSKTKKKNRDVDANPATGKDNSNMSDDDNSNNDQDDDKSGGGATAAKETAEQNGAKNPEANTTGSSVDGGKRSSTTVGHCNGATMGDVDKVENIVAKGVDLMQDRDMRKADGERVG